MKLINTNNDGHGFAQGSLTWLKLRAGKITGSEVHKIMGKKGIGKTGETYIKELISDQFTEDFDFFDTIAMRWGKEHEPEARIEWVKNSGKTVEEIPLIFHNENENIAFSPDGINLNDQFIIEIKCPFNKSNHLSNMLITSQEEFKSEREEYYWQIMLGLYITGFNTCYFISYDPRWSLSDRMVEIEIKRDENDIKLLAERINLGVEMKNNLISKAKLKNDFM